MKWYKTLTIEQRIGLKEACPLICGAPFSFLTYLLGFRDTIEILYEKLKIEGFDV